MINDYLGRIEKLLSSCSFLVDYSFSYQLDEDAGTLKIWLSITFQGGARLDGFEFLIISSESITLEKYRYHFMLVNKTIRWDNAPHYPNLRTFPHHLHIDSQVFESEIPTLEFILKYIKKFL